MEIGFAPPQGESPLGPPTSPLLEVSEQRLEIEDYAAVGHSLRAGSGKRLGTASLAGSGQKISAVLFRRTATD